MTKALAWPAAVILTGLIFRRPLTGVLEGIRLRRITKGDWAADFDAAAKEVRAELPATIKSAPEPAVSRHLDEETERLIEAAPAAAISQAWNQLESCVAVIAQRAGLPQKLLPEILRALVEKGTIQPSVADSVLGLRNMRNLAVHAPPKQLTSERAREFVTMVEAIMWTLQQNL